LTTFEEPTAFEQLKVRFSSPEASEFYGEQVTIAQHMLQAAALAVAASAPRELVVGALLHDIGHVVAGLDPDTRNREHAELAMNFLERHFPPSVREPVRLHVDAKRYLVTTESTYENLLSTASKYTLRLQGGPMSEAECEEFVARPFATDALELRIWDESAKVAELDVPGLFHYQSLIESVLTNEPAANEGTE
jgi:predicted HD phosphohydrolase